MDLSISFITDMVTGILPQAHISKKNTTKGSRKIPNSCPTSSVEIDMGLRKKPNYLFHYGLRKHPYSLSCYGIFSK